MAGKRLWPTMLVLAAVLVDLDKRMISRPAVPQKELRFEPTEDQDEDSRLAAAAPAPTRPSLPVDREPPTTELLLDSSTS